MSLDGEGKIKNEIKQNKKKKRSRLRSLSRCVFGAIVLFHHLRDLFTHCVSVTATMVQNLNIAVKNKLLMGTFTFWKSSEKWLQGFNTHEVFVSDASIQKNMAKVSR